MGRNVAPKFLFLIPLLFVICLGTELVPTGEGSTKAPIGCHKKVYTYRVTQSDSKGFSCSDTINVSACWGRCDSKEISDWKFPFKKSHHPVCVHSGRTKSTVMLRSCDPEASLEAKRYEYMEAISCSCQICSTIDTSCESPQALTRTGGSVVKLIGTDLEEDYSLLPDKV